MNDISKSAKIQIYVTGGQAIEIMGKNGDPTSITWPQPLQQSRYETDKNSDMIEF